MQAHRGHEDRTGWRDRVLLRGLSRGWLLIALIPTLAGCGGDDDPVQPDLTFRVALEPPAIVAAPGESFTVQIRIENVQNLFAARCEISLPGGVGASDPPAERGDLLSEEALFLAVAGTGGVSVGLTELQTEGVDGMTGSGTLARIPLQALATGEGTIGFTVVELIDEAGRLVPGAETMEIASATVSIREP